MSFLPCYLFLILILCFLSFDGGSEVAANPLGISFTEFFEKLGFEMTDEDEETTTVATSTTSRKTIVKQTTTTTTTSPIITADALS
ncbi:CLUMA_CG008589, isoform A [Clunio marinus]|uniref:CLUMA_CG008589, isoform A n=1 Tax=Clunio marinus TaxID=568069 RepID=A0A1J1I444_9DIPT|nr:CLUMA_CG008589, isoform A [Clunio marinus]